MRVQGFEGSRVQVSDSKTRTPTLTRTLGPSNPCTLPRSTMSDERTDRIIQARLKLRQRFLDEMAGSPGVADPRPLGRGESNRHGMPKIPVGQTPTAQNKWPVLDLGRHPQISRRVDVWWRRVSAPGNALWRDLMALEQVDRRNDFHVSPVWCGRSQWKASASRRSRPGGADRERALVVWAASTITDHLRRGRD